MDDVLDFDSCDIYELSVLEMARIPRRDDREGEFVMVFTVLLNHLFAYKVSFFVLFFMGEIQELTAEKHLIFELAVFLVNHHDFIVLHSI